MEYIAHRINKIDELKNMPQNVGVELDLRDNFDGNIYISHEPFINGDDFNDYAKVYSERKIEGTMILNIKSERIEHRALEILKKYNIKDYFFLDSSFPMIYLLSSNGIKNIAIRFSEFEGIDTIQNMQNKIDWIWVDCFTKIPLDKKIYDELKSLNYKLCFVSPELEGRANDIIPYAEYLKSNDIIFDAICTKVYNIDIWKKYFD